MKRTWRRTIVAMAVLVTVLALPVVVGAFHPWSNYHWARTSNPLTLSLGDNVSGNWDTHLTDANSDLNVSTVLDNSVDPGRTNPRKCSPGDGLVEICNAKYGFNGWLGIAGIWVSSSHITKGYVKVNDSYFNAGTYNTPAWRQMVMCQEIGHVFGLGHQDEDFYNQNLGTCMDYTSNPAGPPSNLQPDKHDYDQLFDIYHNGDSSNSWAPAPVDDGSGGGKGNGGGKGTGALRLLALLCRGKTPLAQIQGTMPPPAAPDDPAFVALARQMLRDLAPRWAITQPGIGRRGD